MRILLAALAMGIVLGLCGCETQAGYGGAYIQGEYPQTYYGPAYSYPYSYPYGYWGAPYDRDHYWDRDYDWDRHGYGHWHR